MSNEATQSNPPAIQMRGVAAASHRSSDEIAVEVAEWNVSAGDFWVIGGPQRSGKTDFLMMAGSLTVPVRGEYFFLGERMPVFEEPRIQHRLKLGFVFDGGQLLGRLTVAENVALPLRYHHHLTNEQAEARITALLELTGLTPWAHCTPASLAQSWRQRAGLARALALQPEVLLLDSPLLGLDLRHTSWWLRLLEQLSRGHKILGGRPLTLVATTHDLRPWQRFAGRVAVVSGGKLEVLGDWQSVMNNREAVVQELLHEEPADH